MSADPPIFQLFNEIGIINQLSTRMFERVLPAGMTQAQFTVLNHFVRLGLKEKSPAELAAAFQITRPTMTSTLARMERAGLIAVRADPDDGRGKRVSVTDKGYAMQESCIRAAMSLAPLIEALVDDADIETLLPILRRLRIGLDRARDRPGSSEG